MSIAGKSVELEVRDIKIGSDSGAAGWFASAYVVVTDLDGREAHGWIHLVNGRHGMKIDHFDAYDDVDPELLRFVVATQGEKILAAVRGRSSDVRIAA